MSHAFVLHAPSETETLDGIGRAFAAATARDGGALVVATGVLALVISLVLVLRWLSRERQRDLTVGRALETRHEAALAAVPPTSDPHARALVRVDAHRPLTIQHEIRKDEFTYERCETDDLSGGGLSYLSYIPSTEGQHLRLTLDLGERHPIALRGVVLHVDPPPRHGARSRVSVKLDPMSRGAQEHVIRWVAHEETRAIARARQGTMCARCHRPVADGGAETHATCTMAPGAMRA